MLSVSEPFQRDELAFKKGFEIRTVQVDWVWSVLEQHQGCEFMWTQHLRLLAYRGYIRWELDLLPSRCPPDHPSITDARRLC